jgi:hypothetical protein
MPLPSCSSVRIFNLVSILVAASQRPPLNTKQLGFHPNLSLLPFYPLSGNTCCTKQLCLHSGHSGFSLAQSPIHVQQNTCPHVVTLGSFISSKQSVHLRLLAPIHSIVSSSSSSYRGFTTGGVCVHFWTCDGAAVGTEEAASKSKALLALYEFGSSETSAPPPTMAEVPVGCPPPTAAAEVDVTVLCRCR